MNDLISQVNINQLQSMTIGEKSVIGIINDISGLLPSLETNENLFVQFVMDNDLMLQNKDVNAQIILKSGEKIPIEVSTNSDIKFLSENRGEAVIRIVSNLGNGQFKVKIMPMNENGVFHKQVSDNTSLQNVKNTLNEKPNFLNSAEKINEHINSKLEVTTTIKVENLIKNENFKFSPEEMRLIKAFSQAEAKVSVEEVLKTPFQNFEKVNSNQVNFLKEIRDYIKNNAEYDFGKEAKLVFNKPEEKVFSNLKEIFLATNKTPFVSRISDKIDFGNYVLKSDFGKLFLKSEIKLSVGQDIMLKFSDVTFPKTILQSEAQKDYSYLSSKLSSLSNSMSSPKLVGFMKAAFEGNLHHWLSDISQEQVKTNFGETADLKLINSQLSNLVKETPQWRFVDVPFVTNQEMQKLKVCIKKEETGEKKQKKTTQGQRFLIDTEFSSLGAIQFDGFSQEKKKQFDLVMRSEKVFSEDLCSNILRLFKLTLNELGYSGNLKFSLQEPFVKVEEKENYVYDGLYV